MLIRDEIITGQSAGRPPSGAPAVPLPPPPPITTTNLWDLKADPAAVRQAAQGWSDVATAARTNARAVEAAVLRVYAKHWVGAAAESYNRHQVRLTDDIEQSSGLVDRAAIALEAVASALSNSQSRLNDSWDKVTAKCPVDVSGGNVTFRPATDQVVAAVTAAIQEADQIRSTLDDSLVNDVRELARRRRPHPGR
ncbi:MAG: hypothetical protein DLM59_09885 [Pseudonocardiales bacterium]|nr:MAG: hypothetical protein DLM59_09885 [Pseudonocardiales bacterium]